MKRSIYVLVLLLFFSSVLIAQPAGRATSAGSKAASGAEPEAVAKAAVRAHGGDKLKKLSSFLVKGSVDLSVQGQSMPGAFSTAFSGEKYYFEVITAMQQLKQVFDGTNTSSSIPGISLPPVTSLGFPLLPRIGDQGFVVSELPDGGKKKRGFRVTTPEGFYTDFFVDEKTGQIKGYESKWLGDGDRPITTSVEIDEMMTVEGIVVPKRYAQRFDLGPLTAYANFKAKDIMINSKIEDSAFSLK